MTHTFANLALLQLPAGLNGLLGPIFMYGAIFAIFYFILIRPGQQQRKQQDLLIRAVKKGDEIVTTGGVVGDVIFIKETVGLKMPDGTAHDGYWYATDKGSAIKGQRIDLYTGHSAASMKPMQALNLAQLTAIKVGKFDGCPPQ